MAAAADEIGLLDDAALDAHFIDDDEQDDPLRCNPAPQRNTALKTTKYSP